MKILLVSPFLPWPPHDGARIRILETLRFLSQRHEITLLSNVNSEAELENVNAVRKYCRAVEVEQISDGHVSQFGRMAKGLLQGSSFIQSYHYNEKLARRISTLTATQDFDIVQLELSFMARYVDDISASCRAKKVLATHNVETQRFRRELKLSAWGARRAVLLAESALFPRWESDAVSKFDGAIAVSQSDVNWITEFATGKPVVLVPNGVDTEFFRPGDAATKTTQSIVFTGLMNYPPNSDAVCWFVQDIFPALRQAYPNLVFKIVGARPSEKVQALANVTGVIVTGEVPDIRPYVEEALAFVVPLRSGGGTRLKILQAMALACPIISTAVGAEGLEVSEGEDILFAEDDKQFVQKVGQLIESAEMAERMGQRGRQLVVERYDWKSCLAGVEALYDHLVKGA